MLDLLGNGVSLPVGLAVIGAALAFFGRKSLMTMIVGWLMMVVGGLLLAGLALGIDQGLVMSILLILAAIVFVVFSFVATEYRQVLWGLALLCGVIGVISLFRPTIGDSGPTAPPAAMSVPKNAAPAAAVAKPAEQAVVEVQKPDGSTAKVPVGDAGQPNVVVVQAPQQAAPVIVQENSKVEFADNSTGQRLLNNFEKGGFVNTFDEGCARNDGTIAADICTQARLGREVQNRTNIFIAVLIAIIVTAIVVLILRRH